MATESSAVARFIELQQKERIYGSGEPLPTDPTDPFLPVSRRRTPLMIVFAVIAAGAAVSAGVWAAKSGFWGSSESSAAVSAGSAPGGTTPAAALLGESESEPEGSAPAVVGDLEPAAEEETGGEELDQAPAAVAAEPDPDTGFDLRVEPEGTQVLLDGMKVGAAPLRVRNVAPGRHSVEIVAPEGFFSKHLELVLEQGEPQELEVDLEPVADEEPIVEPLQVDEELAAASDEAEEEEKAEARRPARLSRRERRARRQAERRERRRAARERRREKRAAAQEAPAKPAVSGPAGTLRLGAKPPMAIIIDGRRTGLKTPQRSIELSAGTHRIKLVNREFGISEGFKVRIAPNKTTTVIRDLSDQL